MSFLAPLFLLGALAVALPIVLHLSRRRTPQAIAFPSLMFISKVPYRSMRRRKLRDLLLLALRCAALVAVAVAFARPLLDAASAAPGADRRETVVLLDRSFSMGYGDRWERALAEAREVVGSLADDDAVTLVAFDERAEVVVPPTTDRGRFVAALETLEPSARGTRYVPALKTARAQVLESDAGRREVVLVGDLQRAELGGSLEDARLPPGSELVLRDVTGGEPATERNVALDEVTLDRVQGASAGREKLQVTARAVAFPGDEEQEATLRLELGGRVLDEKRARAQDGRISVAFEPVDVDGSVLTRGRVLATEDALAADNELHFVLSPADAIPVLLLDDGKSRGRALYLERALATARRPRFQIERRSAAEAGPTDFSRARIVVLLDGAALLDRAARTELVRFVESGGGVLAVVARNDTGAGIPELGLAGGEEMQQELAGRSLAFLDYDHPVFEPFAAARSGDFSSASFFRYRLLADPGGSGGDASAQQQGGGEGPASGVAQVLARFDDGSPALVEVRRGGGRVLLWATTLDAEWGDLVLQPVFVPWIDTAFRYLAGYQPPRESYRVGQVARLELPATSGAEWLVIAPSGAKQTFRDTTEALFEVNERGFYQVRPVEGDPSSEISIAANVDPAEADLRQLDGEALVAALTPLAGSAAEPTAGGGREAARNDRTWWYVLFAVLLLLVSESLFSNRRAGRRAA